MMLELERLNDTYDESMRVEDVMWNKHIERK
jgi:hypothetical protein